MRAVCGVVAIDSAMMTFITDAPRTAATAMARRMAGNAIRASMRRMIGLSSGRKEPGRRADERPGHAGQRAPSCSPIDQRDPRAVKSTRDRISRPKWSVPNQ